VSSLQSHYSQTIGNPNSPQGKNKKVACVVVVLGGIMEGKGGGMGPKRGILKRRLNCRHAILQYDIDLIAEMLSKKRNFRN